MDPGVDIPDGGLTVPIPPKGPDIDAFASTLIALAAAHISIIADDDVDEFDELALSRGCVGSLILFVRPPPPPFTDPIIPSCCVGTGDGVATLSLEMPIVLSDRFISVLEITLLPSCCGC